MYTVLKKPPRLVRSAGGEKNMPIIKRLKWIKRTPGNRAPPAVTTIRSEICSASTRPPRTSFYRLLKELALKQTVWFLRAILDAREQRLCKSFNTLYFWVERLEKWHILLCVCSSLGSHGQSCAAGVTNDAAQCDTQRVLQWRRQPGWGGSPPSPPVSASLRHVCVSYLYCILHTYFLCTYTDIRNNAVYIIDCFHNFWGRDKTKGSPGPSQLLRQW